MPRDVTYFIEHYRSVVEPMEAREMGSVDPFDDLRPYFREVARLRVQLDQVKHGLETMRQLLKPKDSTMRGLMGAALERAEQLDLLADEEDLEAFELTIELLELIRFDESYGAAYEFGYMLSLVVGPDLPPSEVFDIQGGPEHSLSDLSTACQVAARCTMHLAALRAELEWPNRGEMDER